MILNVFLCCLVNVLRYSFIQILIGNVCTFLNVLLLLFIKGYFDIRIVEFQFDNLLTAINFDFILL